MHQLAASFKNIWELIQSLEHFLIALSYINIREVECILDRCNVPSLITDQLKYTLFLRCPSIVKMNDDHACNEAKVGHQFEVSMLLMFSIDYCYDFLLC
jgi:hypothetical protein